MRRNQQFLIVAAVALMALAAVTACKTSGMAVTSRAQLLKLDIEHPNDLPEQIREEIAFHPVETIDEVLAIALEREDAPEVDMPRPPETEPFVAA